MWDSKRETDVKNRLLDSVPEGEGGMIWENSIETRAQRATSSEAYAPEACAPQDKPPQWEAQALQQERSPCSLQLAVQSNKDPAQPKIKINKNFLNESSLHIYIQKSSWASFSTTSCQSSLRPVVRPRGGDQDD